MGLGRTLIALPVYKACATLMNHTATEAELRFMLKIRPRHVACLLDDTWPQSHDQGRVTMVVTAKLLSINELGDGAGLDLNEACLQMDKPHLVHFSCCTHPSL
ncbi:hypothetical protein LSAT2_004494 [Lamellibrachia satsuma]|nr:hypothetical protein LSAT2_004494 [Lamellibrachia satsuma]